MPSHAHPAAWLALAMQQSCAEGSTACTASHVLHGLYWVAGVLAIVLVLVIVLAARLWRKNKDTNDEL